MEQAYRPSKDLRDSMVVESSTTTGLGTNLTLVDTALTQGEDYWKDMAVVILSGTSIGQIRRISSFTAATDTITVDTAFAGIIAAGTKYNIVAQYAGTGGGGDATAANQVLILADTNAILIDTAEIGVAGAGLTVLAQASICTEARLVELAAANLPTDIDLIKSDLAGTEVEGTVAALDAYSGAATSTETGADVFTISTTTRKKIHFLGVQISGLTSGATATLRMYTKMLDADASLTKFYSEIFTVGTNVPFVPIVNGTIAIRNNVRVEIQSNNAADTSISAKYHYILESME